jgi:hypothetical protein
MIWNGTVCNGACGDKAAALYKDRNRTCAPDAVAGDRFTT